MKVMKIRFRMIIPFTFLVVLSSCAPGHQDFINFRNNFDLGREIMFTTSPKKFTRAGKFIRGDYAIAGEGLLSVTKNNMGELIYHVFVQEILKNTRTEKEWVGKCLIYYVVDPKTYIVKSWGFDKGGNPLSCRTWP